MIKRFLHDRENLFVILSIAICFAYALAYLNYFEIPSEDFLGNILPPAQQFQKGLSFDTNMKVFPAFPLLIAAASSFLPDISGNSLYSSAIISNIVLYLPYLLVILHIYRRFFNRGQALLAFIFLGFNLNSVYMAVNSELEMLLTLTAALAILLSLHRSRFSYVMAIVSPMIKFDAIGIIPAVMYRDFADSLKKKRIWPGILVSGAVLIAVILFLFIYKDPLNHPYVRETLSRGPSMLRFVLDMFLVAGGFISWMASHAYNSESLYIKLPLFIYLAIFGICVLASLIAGFIILIKKRNDDFQPILVFSGIFILIHMIYQNSKSRYVLPILWILNLLVFYGLFNGIIPFMKGLIQKYRLPARYIIVSSCLILLSPAGILLLQMNAPIRLYSDLFALVFTSLSAAILIHFFRIGRFTPRAAVIILVCSLVIPSVFYGNAAMDHYSLRRIEFKHIGLWYQKNQKTGDVLLITEKVIAQYYSGLPGSRFIMTDSLSADTIPGLIGELKKRKITMVFIDDFYIKRLIVRDKNSIYKKAPLMRELRDNYSRYPDFRLIEVFNTGDTTSYLLGFSP